jgi:hypothetical protein
MFQGTEKSESLVVFRNHRVIFFISIHSTTHFGDVEVFDHRPIGRTLSVEAQLGAGRVQHEHNEQTTNALIKHCFFPAFGRTLFTLSRSSSHEQLVLEFEVGTKRCTWFIYQPQPKIYVIHTNNAVCTICVFRNQARRCTLDGRPTRATGVCLAGAYMRQPYDAVTCNLVGKRFHLVFRF